jgi:hypothetical protein
MPKNKDHGFCGKNTTHNTQEAEIGRKIMRARPAWAA